MLLEAVDINEVRNIQQNYGKAGLLGSHILHKRNLRAGERIRQNAAKHVDKHRETIAFVPAHGPDAVGLVRIGGRIAIIVVSPVGGHLLVLTAIGLDLSDGNTAGGDVDYNRAVRIGCWAAEDDRVCADQAVRAAKGSLAGIGVAHNDTDHVILRHAVAIIAAASDIRAVAPNTRGDTVLPGAFQYRIVDPVYCNNAGASTAVVDEGCVRILYAAEVGLRHESTRHILPQIDTEPGQAVRIGPCKIRVRNNSCQRRGVILRDVHCRKQALDQCDLLLI